MDVPCLVEHFDVGEELTRGGTVRVLQAVRRQDGLEVVVKLPLRPASTTDQRRLEREARRVEGLDHPHLVPFLGLYRSADGSLATVYLRCRGETLLERMRRGPPDPTTALRWLAELAEGLEALHSRGVILRDLKPENVMVAEDGRLMHVDFGLVRGTTGDSVTRASSATASLEYTAPEVFLGEAPGPAQDVYALAVMAYELLAGRLPFRGSPVALASAHLNDPPPPLPPREGLPGRALDRVLARGLAKEPAARPASARELVRRLRSALAGDA